MSVSYGLQLSGERRSGCYHRIGYCSSFVQCAAAANATYRPGLVKNITCNVNPVDRLT